MTGMDICDVVIHQWTNKLGTIGNEMYRNLLGVSHTSGEWT